METEVDVLDLYMNGTDWCFDIKKFYEIRNSSPMAYALLIMQPLASFCVLATIWQVLAITMERYLAVTNPLEQRTLKAKFGSKWICGTIIVVSALLNLIPVPFERMITDCFLLKAGPEGIKTFHYSQLLKIKEEGSLTAALLHLIPDFVFRAPLPILAIALLTGRTIRVCNERHVGGTLVAKSRRNIQLQLALLSFKFILCNTLYMFNTVLIELFGIGLYLKPGWNSDEAAAWHYMNSFYLTDVSNLLLLVHSATNWLLFYNFPKFQRKQSAVLQSSSFTSIQRTSMTEHFAKFALKTIANRKQQIGREILAKICYDMPAVKNAIFSELASPQNYSLILTSPPIQEYGTKVGEFLQTSLEWFADASSPYSTIRETCRKGGAAHFQNSSHFTAQQWKQMRQISASKCTRSTSMNEEGEWRSRPVSMRSQQLSCQKSSRESSGNEEMQLLVPMNCMEQTL
ncbi:unnamed protein product, partial [Mesorhabditis spiculigera]